MHLADFLQIMTFLENSCISFCISCVLMLMGACGAVKCFCGALGPGAYLSLVPRDNLKWTRVFGTSSVDCREGVP